MPRRPNIRNVQLGETVRFVGGVPAPNYSMVDLEYEYEGYVVGRLVWGMDAQWVPVRVSGLTTEILVLVDNLR